MAAYLYNLRSEYLYPLFWSFTPFRKESRLHNHKELHQQSSRINIIRVNHRFLLPISYYRGSAIYISLDLLHRPMILRNPNWRSAFSFSICVISLQSTDHTSPKVVSVIGYNRLFISCN
ncbi:hypothetical protein HanHA300_Chr13g0468781 [Helianthus annuus]|nr:hypothetical protein HanHA300_Chr13g0468781 [Helianthus annuus]KAJ0496503.1 hypothetical protein HanHA89_Chr13g0500571 [Helianthus annuus]